MKWRLRNKRRNSILKTRRYPDLGSASDWLNQFFYADLGSDASSVWNFCTRFSDVISRGSQWWRREMSAVLSAYGKCQSYSLLFFFFYFFLFATLITKNIGKEEEKKEMLQYNLFAPSKC